MPRDGYKNTTRDPATGRRRETRDADYTINGDVDVVGALTNNGEAVGGASLSGPASSTDNAIARYDGTTGKLIQDSSATLNDDGELTLQPTVSVESGETRRQVRIGATWNLAADAGTLYGTVIWPYIDGTGGFGVVGVRGVYVAPTYDGSASSGSMIGVDVAPTNYGAASTEMIGVTSEPVIGGGSHPFLTSFYAKGSVIAPGQVTARYGFAAADAQKFGGGAAITNNFGLYIYEHLAGTNNYAFWYDSPGVFRIKGDGVMAYYNPTFTKYTPGAVNFERVVQQWNSNVLEYGPEKGGTGTLRGMRLIGASLEIAALVAANQTSPTGLFNVMADANGKLYVSNAAN